MDVITVERLDHLGIIAGVIQDVGIIEMIDARIVPDDQEDITTGEAVAGMILNGLGFSDRPMSLTPQFFANKPVALLLRDGVSAGISTASSWGGASTRSTPTAVTCCSARSRWRCASLGRHCTAVQQSGHHQFCLTGRMCLRQTPRPLRSPTAIPRITGRI